MNTFQQSLTDHGDHVVVTLSGDVDFAAHPALAAQLDTLLEAGQTLVVDCAAVTFLDSMGLRALVAGLNAARERGLGFELAAPSPPVLRVLELSGTRRLFPVRGAVPEESGS